MCLKSSFLRFNRGRSVFCLGKGARGTGPRATMKGRFVA